jgi:hypothetical protein
MGHYMGPYIMMSLKNNIMLLFPVSLQQTAGGSYSRKICGFSFENIAKFECFRMTTANKI